MLNRCRLRIYGEVWFGLVTTTIVSNDCQQENDLQILKNSQVRIWFIEGRADPEFVPSYEYQFKMLDPSQDVGARSAKKVPDPSRPNHFAEISTTTSAPGRITVTLEGYYARHLRSKLMETAQLNCPIDIQAHAGACKNPQVFDSFDKAFIFEMAFIESWDSTQLAAISSDEREAILESVQISAREMYEALPIYWSTKASTEVTNEVLDAVYCDSIACGECGDKSTGCSLAFAITKQSGGSPGSPADILFTDNDWVGARAEDIDSLHWDEDPSAIDCMTDYVVVVSNDSASIHYALINDFQIGITPSFTEVTAGVVGAPNDIYSLGRKTFVVGDTGYIYSTTNPTEGLTVEDAGVATAENLNRVHAISEQFAVAVGDNGAVIYTEDGETWSATRHEPTSDNLKSVWIKSQYEWWAGSDGGYLYYTKDKGDSWSVKMFPGYTTGTIHDIVFATDSVVYMTHTTTEGRVLRSYDGGYSWVVLPQGDSVLPASDRINRLAVCEDTIPQIAANHILAVGLDGADGIIIKAQNVEQFSEQKDGNYLVTVDGSTYIVTESGDYILVS